MEIKIQIRDNVYSISIGYQTQWFESLSFIAICKEWYNDRKEVEFATTIWRS